MQPCACECSSPHPCPSVPADLPGFTRSVYERNYALVTPESHVWAGNPRWTNATTAHLISPAVGANFAMLLANMGPGGSAAPPPEGHERCVACLLALH